MNLLDLKGKTAVVTGAGTGIGKATADLLAQAGAAVSRIDIEPGPGIIDADVADEAAMEKAFAKIGPADILVNNAGIAVRKQSLNITREEWDRVIAVNVDGLFLCSRIAARGMKQKGGGAIVGFLGRHRADFRAHAAHQADLRESRDPEDRHGAHAARAPARDRRHRRGDPFPRQPRRRVASPA